MQASGARVKTTPPSFAADVSQSMFKKNKNCTPRAPLRNRRSDDSLVLAGGKNGAWTSHDLRRAGATMMQALGI